MLQICRGLGLLYQWRRRRYGVHEGEVGRRTLRRPTTASSRTKKSSVSRHGSCELHASESRFRLRSHPGRRSTRCSKPMRSDTFTTTADGADRLARTRTWEVSQDVQSPTVLSRPARSGVPRPNNAGGVGDSKRHHHARQYLGARRRVFTKTSERAVVDSRAIVDASRERGSRAGH